MEVLFLSYRFFVHFIDSEPKMDKAFLFLIKEAGLISDFVPSLSSMIAQASLT